MDHWCNILTHFTPLAYLHSMANKRYYWHALIWTIYVIYQLNDFYVPGDQQFKFIALCMSYMTAAILTFYLFYGFIWQRFLGTSRYWISAPLSLLGLLFFIIIRYVLEEVIYEYLFGFGNYVHDDFIPYAIDNIWRAIFYASFSLIVYLLERRQMMQTEMMQLNSEKSAAEMSFLRSQLNPHFLFNTLSFLHTKAMKVDPELSDTILKLSDMLRYSIQHSDKKLVSIESEIKLLKNYVSIFENRFKGKFFVDFIVEDATFPVHIEPLLLIPFVENMFKHGVMNDASHPGKISLQYEGRNLKFICTNMINTYQKDEKSGIGLDNVRRRLVLSYPNKHALVIRKENGIFYTSLTVQV